MYSSPRVKKLDTFYITNVSQSSRHHETWPGKNVLNPNIHVTVRGRFNYWNKFDEMRLRPVVSNKTLVSKVLLHGMKHMYLRGYGHRRYMRWCHSVP